MQRKMKTQIILLVSITTNIILLFYSAVLPDIFAFRLSFLNKVSPILTKVGAITNEKILIFRSSYGYKSYDPAHDSVHCFAKSAGHKIIDVNLDTDQYANSSCKEFMDKNFLRHCVLAQYLNKSEASYALALEGDASLINPHNTIKKYIDPYASLIFFERFRTFEIAAGSFIVKNDAYGIQFLMDWARYYHKQPQEEWSNSDNGALLSLILEKRSVASYERSICTKLWQNCKSQDDLTKYIQCVNVFLGARRKNSAEKIKILRRGHAWMRDQNTGDGYWCENDFFFHDMKADYYSTNDDDSSSPYSVGAICLNTEAGANYQLGVEHAINVNDCKLGQVPHNFHLKDRLKISCSELQPKLYKQLKLSNSLLVPFFRDEDLECWPHCDD